MTWKRIDLFNVVENDLCRKLREIYRNNHNGFMNIVFELDVLLLKIRRDK
jgi:hypothetical protein